jgi:hypothetical protein
MHDIPSYYVSQTRNVNTLQLLDVCKAHKQLKQVSKSGVVKRILLLEDMMFIKIVTYVFI